MLFAFCSNVTKFTNIKYIKHMKTNQLMKRPFMSNATVTQRTKDGYFNATELLTAFNSVSTVHKRLPEFWENNNTQAFIRELEAEIINVGNSPHLETYQSSRGKGGGTWMHPYLFVKFAMWLSPKFELQVIKWTYDNLIEFRNQAGDHYREMCETIAKNYESYFAKRADPLVFQKEIKYLNSLVYGSFDGGKRNELNEKELRLLNDLQKLNIKLIDSKQFGLRERRNRLAEYASNYKMLNF